MVEFKEIRRISSNKNIIRDFEDLFLDFKNRFYIKDDVYFKIMVAVTEGINNAAGHGNKFNPEKNVTVELEGNSHYMKCRISDEGLGFNPENVADPRNPENLLKDNGRGVFLMRELANEFYVQKLEQGTLVELIFNF
jgi:serine/threonine-protein kinase RsbW